MKKSTLFVISILLMLFMFGCREQLTDIPGTTQKENETQNQAETQDQTENLPKTEEHLISVLKDNQPFYSAASKADMRISDYHRNIWKFARVDLDSDDKNEIAVMFEDGSILILRKDGNSVTGFDFGLHAMYQINKDGSYMWNENAGNTYGCSTLRFSDNACETVELWRVEHDGAGAATYYVDGKAVSQEAFQTASANNSQESVVWTIWADIQ